MLCGLIVNGTVFMNRPHGDIHIFMLESTDWKPLKWNLTFTNIVGLSSPAEEGYVVKSPLST